MSSIVWRVRSSFAEVFLIMRLREDSSIHEAGREKKEAPGRITSASPRAQSICTVPHWITSFSAKMPISTRMSTPRIIKPFSRIAKVDFVCGNTWGEAESSRKGQLKVGSTRSTLMRNVPGLEITGTTSGVRASNLCGCKTRDARPRFECGEVSR